MSRLEQSSKNILYTITNNVFISILGIVARTVFIYSLGTEYLGLSGLLSNILGFLSISELGIATAIGFSLYKPLAEKDYASVSALMSLYRKAYAVIGVIVMSAGLLLYPLLDFFIPPAQQPEGITFAYFAFLTNSVVGYFVSYKITLINSDNNAYRIVPIAAGFSLVQTILQIVELVIFKSYIGYLFIQISCSILSVFCQGQYISKYYPEVDFYSKKHITKDQETTIKKNIGGLMIAKLGDYLVNSTDNLIIAKLVSLSATGIYSNYLLIRNLVNSYIGTIFAGTSAAMGNVVAVEDDEKKLELFETLFFTAFVVYSFEAVCFICLFNPFIGKIWIGSQFTFGIGTVAVIVFNNFLTGLRMPIITMKSAAGVYMEDSWVPFAFSGINLVASIVLAHHYGVTGVFLGTIIGSMFTADWFRPLIIYRNVFHASVLKYYKKYILYVICGACYMIIGYLICDRIEFEPYLIAFILKAFVAVCLPIVSSFILFRKQREFKALQVMGTRVLSSLLKKGARWIKR